MLSTFLFNALNCAAENTSINDARTEEALKFIKLKIPVSNINQASLHEASTLLISCSDFRLRDETFAFLKKMGLTPDKTDEYTIPGASLGFVISQYNPSFKWDDTSIQVLVTLVKLHDIRRIIILDHRGCGAYKLAFKDDALIGKPTDIEKITHAGVIKKAAAIIKQQNLNVKIYSMLIGLDGIVENLTEVI